MHLPEKAKPATQSRHLASGCGGGEVIRCDIPAVHNILLQAIFPRLDDQGHLQDLPLAAPAKDAQKDPV